MVGPSLIQHLVDDEVSFIQVSRNMIAQRARICRGQTYYSLDSSRVSK